MHSFVFFFFFFFFFFVSNSQNVSFSTLEEKTTLAMDRLVTIFKTLFISIFFFHSFIHSIFFFFKKKKKFVNFGVEILKIVPGRVSTEVDAR